ncbi:hypothetical protein [Candidatus Nitrosocosmicus hydrocola]|uniref:hypothetical protein n=1 Tax=Candidatus Nitrosocosmicus hydrocola TaxID=1826872 RepID=UPI0018C8826B|nr:hypothetical protein [Candidatus Nitrosocosmicus hydrocola]
MIFWKNLFQKKKSPTFLVLTGLVLLILGIVFQLQSISLIGPNSSFMYANENWTLYGIIVAIIGIIVLTIGMFWLMVKHRS